MSETAESAGPPGTESSHAPERRIAWNFSVRLAGDILARVASLFFFVVAARELGAAGFGDLTFALSFAGVLVVAAGIGLDTLLAREVARDHRRLDSFLGNVLTVKAVAVPLLLGVAAVVVTVADYDRDARLAVYLAGLGVMIENLGRTWHAAFQAYERMQFTSISLVVQRTATAAVGIVLLLSGFGLVGVTAVYAAGAVLGTTLSAWMLRHYVVRVRWRVQLARLMPLIRAGIPIGVATLLFTLLLRLDVVLLSFLSGGDNTEVGVYGAAFRLVEATMFVSWAFGAAMLPWLARQRTGSLGAGYEAGVTAITVLLMPLATAFMVRGDQIIDIVYGDEFSQSSPPLRLLGPVVVLYAVNYLTATMLTAQGLPGAFNKLAAAVCVQNIATNVVLIPPYGATGVAVSALSSGVFLCLLSLREASLVAGRVRAPRIFAAALAGAAVMAGILAVNSLPLLYALVLGCAGYLAAVIAFERLAFPDDFALFRRAIRRAATRSDPRTDVNAWSEP